METETVSSDFVTESPPAAASTVPSIPAALDGLSVQDEPVTAADDEPVFDAIDDAEDGAFSDGNASGDENTAGNKPSPPAGTFQPAMATVIDDGNEDALASSQQLDPQDPWDIDAGQAMDAQDEAQLSSDEDSTPAVETRFRRSGIESYHHAPCLTASASLNRSKRAGGGSKTVHFSPALDGDAELQLIFYDAPLASSYPLLTPAEEEEYAAFHAESEQWRESFKSMLKPAMVAGVASSALSTGRQLSYDDSDRTSQRSLRLVRFKELRDQHGAQFAAVHSGVDAPVLPPRKQRKSRSPTEPVAKRCSPASVNSRLAQPSSSASRLTAALGPILSPVSAPSRRSMTPSGSNGSHRSQKFVFLSPSPIQIARLPGFATDASYGCNFLAYQQHSLETALKETQASIDALVAHAALLARQSALMEVAFKILDAGFSRRDQIPSAPQPTESASASASEFSPSPLVPWSSQNKTGGSHRNGFPEEMDLSGSRSRRAPAKSAVSGSPPSTELSSSASAVSDVGFDVDADTCLPDGAPLLMLRTGNHSGHFDCRAAFAALQDAWTTARGAGGDNTAGGDDAGHIPHPSTVTFWRVVSRKGLTVYSKPSYSSPPAGCFAPLNAVLPIKASANTEGATFLLLLDDTGWIPTRLQARAAEPAVIMLSADADYG